MDSVSSTSSLLNTLQVGAQGSVSKLQQAGIGGTDSDGDNDGSARVRRGGRSQFASAVFQALSQSGISFQRAGGSGSGIGGTDKDGDNDGAASGANGAVPQAFHAFMHSLFQALNQGGTAASAGTDNDSNRKGAAQPAHGHNRLAEYEGNAQQLLQSLNSGNAAGNATLTSLQSSFQDLLQATGTSSSGSNAQPTLQAFLQSLVQGLGGGSVQAAGNILQSQA